MTAQVQLIAGPARCGKTQQLLHQYRQTLGNSQSLPRGRCRAECCWLAPNQIAVSQLQDRLMGGAGTGRPAVTLLQPNLRTFASFAEDVILGSRRRLRPISSTQKKRLLQQVIRDSLRLGKLEHFSRVAATPGFVLQVEEFIAELKKTDTWPDEFAERCARRPRSDRRSRELSHLYSTYQQLLRRGGLYDSEGRFWAAREILAESTVAKSQRFDLVVVNGFNDFTAAQYDILRLIGECSYQLKISLTGETASEEAGAALLFAKTSRTLARLQEIFPQLEIESLQTPPADKDSLWQLQREVFREDENSATGQGRPIEGVGILAANSELGEVEAIAGRIKALLLAGKTQPQEIVVVCRGGASTAALVEAVFPDFGIPYASEIRPSLEADPVVRSLQTLLDLHQEDWPFQTLLDVINNRLLTEFDATCEGALPPRVAIERCLRSAQLPSGREALISQLEYRRDVAAPADGGGDNKQLEAEPRGAEVSIALSALRRLDESLGALPDAASIGAWVQSLEQLLAQLGTFSSLKDLNVAWKQLCRCLRQIEQVDAWSQSEAQRLTLSDVQELIASVAREQRLPATHDAVGRVQILSAESARKLSTKHLFLMGLGEQAFSSVPATTDDTTPSTEDQPAATAETEVGRSDAMLLFYELATRPTASLTMSYPALDAKGQPLSPSPLLTELERSVGEGRITRSAMSLGAMSLGQGGDLDSTSYSISSFRRQAVALALDGKQRNLAGMISHPKFVRTGSSILAGIDCVAGRSIREGYGPYEGLLLSDTAQAALARRYDAEHLWSPSRLEGYSACPFRYFAERLLGLEPLAEMTLRNDPRRRGSLLHLVLATIHEELSGAGTVGETEGETASEVDGGELVERFLGALEMAVKASPLRGIAHSLREIERREIEAWAEDYAEQELSYRQQWKHLDEPPRPAHFEVRFGPETRHSAGEAADCASTTLPFELDLGDERICLTGAIDRVDIGRVGGVTVFNIIDYKSGQAVKLTLDKVRSGHQLQLPLYALAAEQLLLADQQALALATGYWNIQGKGFDGKKGGSLQLRELSDQTLKTTADWKTLQPEIMARVQEIINGIRGGQFPVFNEDENCTRSCSLSTVCRVAQIRSLEKVWPPELPKPNPANPDPNHKQANSSPNRKQANPDRKGAGENAH